MLDIKLFRENTDELKAKLAKKGVDPKEVDLVTSLDRQRRDITYVTEQLKSKQNTVSKQIPSLKKKGRTSRRYLRKIKPFRTR